MSRRIAILAAGDIASFATRSEDPTTRLSPEASHTGEAVHPATSLLEVLPGRCGWSAYGFRPRPLVFMSIVRPRVRRTQQKRPFLFPKEWPQKTTGAGYPFGSQAIPLSGTLGFAPPGYPGFTLSRIAASPYPSDRRGRHFRFSKKFAGGSEEEKHSNAFTAKDAKENEGNSGLTTKATETD
jgi:hypothetical protein